MPGPNHQVRMSSRPRSHRSNGGIDCVASSWISDGERVDVVALERLDVAREQLARRPRRAAARSSRGTSSRSSVARARWSALLTEATLVSSSSATSVACQRSTSQRISTARWRGGRCCSAATNASRIVSRATATSAGSPSDERVRRDRLDPRHLGQRVQVLDDRLARRARGPSAARGARGRSACRGRRSSRSGRATSGAPRGPRSGRSSRQARISVSWTASSASNGEPSIR